jgi:hypothetical protein
VAGDPLGALNRVALRDDSSDLAVSLTAAGKVQLFGRWIAALGDPAHDGIHDDLVIPHPAAE